MKAKLLSVVAITGLALGLGGIAGGTNDAQAQPNIGGQSGGAAAGLIAAVVQVQNVPITVFDVVDINNNNVLNNSLNNLNVEVLRGGVEIEEFLNDLNVDVNVDIDDIIAIVDVLGGGFVVVT